MKVDLRKYKLGALIFLFLFAAFSLYLWGISFVVGDPFQQMSLRIAGILLIVALFYLSLTFDDKSKSARPWLSSTGVMISLLFDILIMFGAIAVLKELVGLQINKTFILSLFAVSIYLLVGKAFLKENKYLWLIMIPFLIINVAGHESYKWQSLVLFVGLANNEIFGRYIIESIVMILGNFRDWWKERKPARKKNKKGKKKILFKKTKIKKKKKR